MASAIDPTKPADGVPASKAALRNNLQAAKVEIEALQAAQIPSGGSTGQVLVKSSNADNDTAWSDPASASPSALGDLSDVDLATAPPEDGQPLLFDHGSGSWRPGDLAAGATSLGGLSDVDLATAPPAAGQVLGYDEILARWRPTAPGASSIAGLSDVDTATVPPEPGQALVWDGAFSAWRPADVDPPRTEAETRPLPVANPGAETGNLSGWTAESGSWSARPSVLAMGAAHSGAFFFYQQSGSDGVLSQTFDLVALGFTQLELDFGATFALSGWAGSAVQSDQGRIEIDWLAADDGLIATATSGDRGPTNPLGTWEPVDVVGSVPTGTRKCKLRLTSINRSGSNSAYAFDDLALALTVRLPAEPGLGDLADVDLASVAPLAGDGLRFDGTLWRPAARRVEVRGQVEGRPTASQVVVRYVAAQPFTLPATFAGSRAAAGTAGSAAKTFDVRRNGGAVGTIDFAAGATSATFTAAGAVALVPGDLLTVIAPSSRDTTLAGIAITLLGSA